MADNKKDKASDTAATEKTTNRESTVDAPKAPALAEANQSANGEGDDTKALDQDKTPPIGGLAPDAEKAAAGDENPPEGEAGSENGDITQLTAMCRDAPLFVGGPTTADVHPDEVENWVVHGWVIDPDA